MPNRVDDLLERVSRAVRTLPGAVELYLFGSAADPQLKDAWSDLDLQVLSVDYLLSRAYWPWILDRVAPIELVYPILEKPQESVFCVIFAGESPYHKVDIGLGDISQAHGFIHQVKQKTCLWRQYPPGPAAFSSSCEAFHPDMGTPLHFLIGELLGSIRYVKARKRRQHLTCWRFLSARLNALLRSHQWEGGSPVFPASSLNTWDFAALDRRLPEADRLRWLELVDCRTPGTMDDALIALTHLLIERVYPGCATDNTPAAQLIREMLHFIERELANPDANAIGGQS